MAYQIGKRYRIVDIHPGDDFRGVVEMLVGLTGTWTEDNYLDLDDPPEALTRTDTWRRNNHMGGNVIALWSPILEEVADVLTKEDLQVGMRVRAEGSVRGVGKPLTGQIGIVKVAESPHDSDEVGVVFDEKVPQGHSLNGRCEAGYGLWVGVKNLTILGQVPSLDAFELAWSDYLDQDGNPDHKEAFQAGWEARGGAK